MAELDSAALWSITLRTVGVCLASLSIALAFGVPIGIWLGGRLFLGRRLLLGLVNSGMGAPPVVVGLLVAQMFYRSGPLGHLELWYSVEAMVVAQVMIALPLVKPEKSFTMGMIVRRQDPVPPLVEAFREAVGDIDMERVFRPGDLFKADQVKSETAISSSV